MNKVKVENVVESIARLNESERNEMVKILVNKWSSMTANLTSSLDAYQQDKLIQELTENKDKLITGYNFHN
jgi:hypothetical protein|tara:strand:+ start:52 stop:264 length:213 start_codon:yes stop_codon:yes gene_type:complete